jgi:hypothetical protein
LRGEGGADAGCPRENGYPVAALSEFISLINAFTGLFFAIAKLVRNIRRPP